MSKLTAMFLVGFSVMSSGVALAQATVPAGLAASLSSLSSPTDRKVELGASRTGLESLNLGSSSGAAAGALQSAAAGEAATSFRLREALATSSPNPLAGALGTGLGSGGLSAAFGSGAVSTPDVPVLLGVGAGSGAALSSLPSEQPATSIRLK